MNANFSGLANTFSMYLLEYSSFWYSIQSRAANRGEIWNDVLKSGQRGWFRIKHFRWQKWVLKKCLTSILIIFCPDAGEFCNYFLNWLCFWNFSSLNCEREFKTWDDRITVALSKARTWWEERRNLGGLLGEKVRLRLKGPVQKQR